MKLLISVFLLGFFYAQAQPDKEPGPFKLMSALEEIKLSSLNSKYRVIDSFTHEIKVPKGLKFVVDKNIKNAPQGMYKVYPVPEGSEFGVESSEKFFQENSDFKDQYKTLKDKALTDCKPNKENPYKCLPHFYVRQDQLGTQESLEVRVAKTAEKLNETVNRATTKPLKECSDCQKNLNLNSIQDTKAKAIKTTDCQIRLSGSMVNCNSKDKTMRSTQDVEKMVCLYERSEKDFCPGVQNELKRIEIVADIMGLDKRQMACMTLIESAFRTKACSNEGACGITQFMPVAARESEKRIQNEYAQEWKEYQERVGGTPFSIKSVTAHNIRKGHISYGIFAMGAYLRDSLRYHGGTNLEETWRIHIKNGGDPRNLFHAQIAAYNWRPSEFDNITESVVRGDSTPIDFNSKGKSTPKETDRYMKLFDSCLYKKSSNDWDLLGDQPSSSKANSCNLRSDKPACEKS